MNKVSVNQAKMFLEELDRINSLNLEDIVFIDFIGEKIVIPDDALVEWKIGGLDNTAFIRDYFMGRLG